MDQKKIIFNANKISKVIEKKKIIDELSLSLYENEIFGLLGLNGAGKTTIIKLISGLIKLSSGSIELLGANIQKNFEYYIRNIGVSFDIPVLYEYMTGYQNLKYFSGFYPDVNEEKITYIINSLKLNEIIYNKVSTYSLGMRQKLNLGQAILHSPQLLILDEPTNGLDPRAIKELRDILMDYVKNNKATVLISSHNLLEVQKLCNRVGIMDKGKLLQIYNIEEILKLDLSKDCTLEEIFLHSIDKEITSA